MPLFFSFLYGKRVLGNLKISITELSAVVFLIYCLASSFICNVPINQFAWALRLNFRFFVFYYSCICLLSCSDIYSIFNLFKYLFVINLFVTIFQHFIQGFSGDYLGGIFGIYQGANTYTNIFLVCFISFELTLALNNKENRVTFFVFLIISLLIASLAEIKFYFFEILFLIAVCLIALKPSFKLFAIIFLLIVSFLVGLNLLKSVYPESYELLFSKQSIYSYLDASWANGIEIGRTTGIDFVNRYFFSSSSLYSLFHLGFGNFTLNKLFGFGFGSCEFSSGFSSAFSLRYSFTNYSAFEFIDKYLEIGVVGLFAYGFFFVTLFIRSIRLSRHNDPNIRIMSQFCLLLVPLIIINIWYGNLRTEASYFFFFSLASLQIALKSIQSND